MSSEFAGNLRRRVVAAQEAVRAARAAGDEHGAEAHEADLANLRRLAAEHGVPLAGQRDGR